MNMNLKINFCKFIYNKIIIKLINYFKIKKVNWLSRRLTKFFLNLMILILLKKIKLFVIYILYNKYRKKGKTYN